MCRLGTGAMSLEVVMTSGDILQLEQDSLDTDLSSKLFQRTGQIARIEVQIPDSQVLRA